MKIRILIGAISFLLLFTVKVWAANITSITNVTLNPPNPSPGQTVTLTWTYNVDSAFNNPHAEVAINGNGTVLQSAGTANQWIVLGDGCVPTTQVSGGCAVGSNVPAGANAVTEVITIPTTLTPGFTYRVIVGMKDYNVYMNPSVSVDTQNYASFTIPLPPPYIHLSKVAEGTTASAVAVTKVLYTIYYDASNITNFQITDAVDPSLTIVTVYNGGSAVGQNITWNLGNISSPQKSFVSFLAQVPSGLSVGTVIHNTAIGSSVEVPSSPSNDAQVAVGVAELSIQKSVNLSSAQIGQTLTYSLNYTNGGTSLAEYQNFDSGSIPLGWNNTGGTWTVSGGVLAGTAPSGQFPGLIDSTMAPIHDGIYTVDMTVSSLDSGYFDAVFVFNASSPTTVGNAYHARISSDTNDLGFEYGGTTLKNQVMPNGYNILNDAWYTVKVQVCGNQFSMKVWPRGGSEPTTWAFTQTDNTLTGTGYAGFQANGGPVSFDNLKIFSSLASTNPRVYDTIPTGITYVGCNNGCTNSGGILNWNVGSTCGSPLGVSWWGVVNSCAAPITNTGAIDSDDPPPPVASNSVITSISGCSTNTFTNTPTSTFTSTNTPTFTSTFTPTPTFTSTLTNTFTNTPTVTPTFTPTFTVTSTFTLTNTGTLPPTNTPTNTFTSTSTFTSTNTSTNTPTFTSTFSPTFTFTPTHSPTFTNTSTFTNTLTPSFTFTRTNTPTLTPTFTLTFTPTITPTPTATPPSIDIFYANKNLFNPASDGAVSILVEYSRYPGDYSLRIYNSAGEHIRTLDSKQMNGPVSQYYAWDGKNKYGDVCASGVYVLYLIEPFDRKLKRILLVR